MGGGQNLITQPEESTEVIPDLPDLVPMEGVEEEDDDEDVEPDEEADDDTGYDEMEDGSGTRVSANGTPPPAGGAAVAGMGHPQEPEGVLLVDARNGFNELGRKAAM